MFNRFFSPRRSTVVIGPADAIVVGPGEALLVGPQTEPAGQAADWQIGRTPVQVRPAPVIQVQPPPRGLWDERGWVLSRQGSETIYQGPFQFTNRRTRRPQEYPGRIHVRGSQVEMYIYNPPAEIKRHPKGPCFAPAGLPWFHLHWHRPASSVDDAILYMEKILAESMTG